MTRSLFSTKALIFNDKNEVLVLRRSETHPRKPHQSDLPGGLVENGEFGRTGLIREVAEETGIILKPSQCMLYYANTSKPHPDVVMIMLMYYVKFDITPEVNISWEHESYSWIPLGGLVQLDDLEDVEKQSVAMAIDNNLLPN